MYYTIGEMAKKLGVAASTLRYYDKEGLLPFVERSGSGIRVFKDSDLEFLRLIECMKQTGMPLRDIRDFVHMSMEGDSTINDRLEMCINQRNAIISKINAFNETLKVLDYKCWYYETAKAAGTTAVLEEMTVDELPEKFQSAKMHLLGDTI